MAHRILDKYGNFFSFKSQSLAYSQCVRLMDVFQHRAGSQETTQSAECTRATIDITGRKRGEVRRSLGHPGEVREDKRKVG